MEYSCQGRRGRGFGCEFGFNGIPCCFHSEIKIGARMNWTRTLDVRARIALAAALVAVMAFSFIGRRAIWSTDEGRYTAVALQMVATGDWIHPAFNSEEAHYTKPPLVYWALAASMKVFGTTETAARLPGALAFAATCVAFGLLARRLMPGVGPAGMAAYAVTLLPMVASNIITTDTILTLWEALALLAFAQAWTALDPPQRGRIAGADAPGGLRRGWLRMMWLAFGCAFMTKGPPGLVFLPVFAFVLWRWGGGRAMARLFDPAGILLFVVVSSWWFAWVVFGQWDLGRYFLRDEVYERIFTSARNRNPQWWKAFFYLRDGLFGMLPWSVLWFVARPWKRWRLLRLREDPAALLLGGTVLLPLAVFMLAKSRLTLYVLPLYGPLVVATMRLVRPRWWRTAAAWGAMSAMAALLCAGRFGAGMIEHKKDMKRLMARLDLPGGYEEIVFVDRRPMHGLSFYSGVPCEEVDLVPDERLKEPLEEELEDLPPGARLLLIVRPKSEAGVRELLARRGWQMTGRRLDDDYLAMRVVKLVPDVSASPEPRDSQSRDSEPSERPQGRMPPPEAPAPGDPVVSRDSPQGCPPR